MLTLAVPTLMAALGQQVPMEKLEALKPRAIGPAGMSGRVTSIAVVPNNPNTFYIGTASGGLWKTESGGISWTPLFDTMAVASIGAVALDPGNPSVVWVGTGEGNPRNSQTNGNGVYRSLDGGKTWKHLGLDQTRNIHRVIVHPGNPQVVYVGAIGAAWGDSPDRGVYRTTDGGKSWKKILYLNNRTGVADLVMDPTNPNKLIAAMWDYRRWPWFFSSGGKGSGLHVTFDGGETWKKRTEEDGLPKGTLGRIGVAIAPSRPNVVYALIEAKKNGLYRSDDGGFTWKKRADKNIGSRPFYYSEIYVDPTNENRVYNLYTQASVSEDGGKTFRILVRGIHVDHHAWYIHPDDPDFLIDGNDGGLAISRDRGRSWRFVENLPLAQYYHISVDMERPYNVYGGMQDNGTWIGPAYLWGGTIWTSEWELLSFGDGFDVVPDPGDSRYGYSMSQGGNLFQYDRVAGTTRLISPLRQDGVPLRFNWNAGIAQDPFNVSTLYYGSQFLHKSTDRGFTWETISPDLTTNDPSKQKQLQSGGLTYDVTNAENFTTIITIAPSPLDPGVIWVGTDDGNVQLTRDGGKSWTNVVENVRGVPDTTWVAQIQASLYKPGEAFVVFDNHRRNDWTPYLYHTTDYGSSWNRLADEEDLWGFVLSFVQDPMEPRLMFCGTEFGLYISIDAGKTWTKWKHGYPTVSTMDMAIHPREGDLIIGTFGRAAYVLDDLGPLRVIAREGVKALDAPLRVFDIPGAVGGFGRTTPGEISPGSTEFRGENRPFGARITFVANPDTSKPAKEKKPEGKPKDPPDRVTVEVLDSEGRTVRTFKETAKPGINRIRWGINRWGPRFPHQEKPAPGSPERGGPLVLPGTYLVRLTMGEHRDSARVEVTLDPRLDISDSDLKAYYTYLDTLIERIGIATEAADRLREARKTIGTFNGLLAGMEADTLKELKKTGKTLQDSITTLLELINEKETKGITKAPELLGYKIRSAYNRVNSSWGPVSGNDSIGVAFAMEALKEVTATINGFFQTEWPKYTEAVKAAEPIFFKEYEPLEIPD
jgi:photosystem II stability/assembly factor-like uncharacterized protein